MSDSDSITIAGFEFAVPNRYSAGHTLNEGEASALNQTYHENLRNNFAKQVKEAKGEGETLTDAALADLQAKLDAYADKYEFGVRVAGSPRAPSDPVGKEAFNLAKEAVRNAIRKKGLKVADYSAEQIGTLAKGALEKNKERFMTLAQQRVAEREALAADSFETDIEAPAPSTEGGESEAPKAKGKGKKVAEAA